LLSTNFEKWKAEGFTRRAQSALPDYIKMELPQPDPDFTTDGEPLMKAVALAKP